MRTIRRLPFTVTIGGAFPPVSNRGHVQLIRIEHFYYFSDHFFPTLSIGKYHDAYSLRWHKHREGPHSPVEAVVIQNPLSIYRIHFPSQSHSCRDRAASWSPAALHAFSNSLGFTRSRVMVARSAAIPFVNPSLCITLTTNFA